MIFVSFAVKKSFENFSADEAAIQSAFPWTLPGMCHKQTMSGNTPALSVVMPVRNGAAYLEAAIQSILDQTFSDFEFIIIDDSSVDCTPTILSAFQTLDSRIRVFPNSGGGIVAALNLGVETAQAPLIARMDADDMAFRERFAVQAEAMRNMPPLVALGSAAITIEGGA